MSYKFEKNETVELITNSEKKKIRNDLIKEAAYYNERLLNKEFWIFLDDNITNFKIIFDKKRFSHLTGVCSNLSAVDFFDLCLGKVENDTKRFINLSDFFTTTKHTKHSEMEKAEIFMYIDKLFSENLFVAFDIKTKSKEYKLGLVDIKLSLLCDMFSSITYIPFSLRKKSYLESSSKQLRPKYIFLKNVNDDKYSKYTYPKKIDIINDDIVNNPEIDKDNLVYFCIDK